MLGPDGRLRRRDGFKLTDARMTAARGAERDPLLPALPRARQGLVLEGPARQGRRRSRSTRSASRSTAARSTRRSPRCTCCASAGDAIGALALVMHRQPDVPGHRPPHLQRLHEGLHLPEAGAGQHPADRDRRADRRARAAVGRRDLRPAHALESAQRRAGRTRCRTTARTCSSSASGPAGYTLAHYLLNEGFGVVGIDGLKIEPLPDDIDRHDDGARRSRSATGARSTGELDERVLEGFGGVSEYGITVRWDKNFLTLLHLTLARRDEAAHLRRRPLRRHADDRRCVGATASITSRSRPAPAGRRSST